MSNVLFAQSSNSSDDGMGVAWIILGIVAGIISIVACWRMYQKARKPGWASIIPLYNVYVLLKIVNRPGWWLLLYLIPLVNVIVHLIVSMDTARVFGKSDAFGVLLIWLLGPIGIWMIGFGDATYKASK